MNSVAVIFCLCLAESVLITSFISESNPKIHWSHVQPTIPARSEMQTDVFCRTPMPKQLTQVDFSCAFRNWYLVGKPRCKAHSWVNLGWMVDCWCSFLSVEECQIPLTLFAGYPGLACASIMSWTFCRQDLGKYCERILKVSILTVDMILDNFLRCFCPSHRERSLASNRPIPIPAINS